jgi:transposase-like protein
MNLTDPIYSDENKARELLEKLHWPNGPVCPRCKGKRATKVGGTTARPGLYNCNDCRRQFTVTVGTIMEDSKIPLNKWLFAYARLNGGKKGVSAHELHRSLGISYKTAWFMAHRIRETMTDDGSPLGGPGMTIEADEAYVGGKQRNRAFRKVAPKKMVVSLVERGGRARSFHVANIDAGKLRGALVTNVDRASHLRTDGSASYRLVGLEFASHKFVDHSIEYARGDRHSNTAENFFSILKRGVIGTYHHWSPAHIHRYLAEFDFRYSTKSLTDAERTEIALRNARGKRLYYRQPNSLAA